MGRSLVSGRQTCVDTHSLAALSAYCAIGKHLCSIISTKLCLADDKTRMRLAMKIVAELREERTSKYRFMIQLRKGLYLSYLRQHLMPIRKNATLDQKFSKPPEKES